MVKKNFDIEKTNLKIKFLISILSVLLVISLGILAGRYVYLNYFSPTEKTITISDSFASKGVSAQTTNVVVAENSQTKDDSLNNKQASVIELYKGNKDANQKFEADNMFPGDCITKYFSIKTYHNKDIPLFFYVDINKQTKDLAKVLNIKVTNLEDGKVLCDAPLQEVNGNKYSSVLESNQKGQTITNYKIDVYVDTSVNNDYQEASLSADFYWEVDSEEGLTVPSTGDMTNYLLWIVLTLGSVIILLLVYKYKKERKNYE